MTMMEKVEEVVRVYFEGGKWKDYLEILGRGKGVQG